ncbi:hypothetical protein LINGRAHAP2_LOCUS7346 [Linum grandiflorum]
MRWYVEDDGLPQASLVSEEDVNRLFQYEEDSRRLEFSGNEDIEDVSDESLLPLKEEAFVNSQRSDLRPAIGKIILSFDNQWFEKMNNRLSEKGSPLWAILLYNSDLLAQKLKEAADSLAQASNAIPEAYKIRNRQSAEEMITTTDSLQVNEPETKSKGRKRQGSARKETASKKQNSDSKKVEAASLKWLPDDK